MAHSILNPCDRRSFLFGPRGPLPFQCDTRSTPPEEKLLTDTSLAPRLPVKSRPRLLMLVTMPLPFQRAAVATGGSTVKVMLIPAGSGTAAEPGFRCTHKK